MNDLVSETSWKCLPWSQVCSLTCRTMDQEQSVNAIMEYVSSLEACPHIQELKAVMDEVEQSKMLKSTWGGHWTVLPFPPKMVSFIISWSLEERPLELFWMRSWMRFSRRPCRWFVQVEMKSILLFHCQVREDMDLWREKGAEEEKEKVKVEGEIQEMQQKKMVTEEEKRRYFSLFSSHMKKWSQVSWEAGEGHQHAAGL